MVKPEKGKTTNSMLSVCSTTMRVRFDTFFSFVDFIRCSSYIEVAVHTHKNTRYIFIHFSCKVHKARNLKHIIATKTEESKKTNTRRVYINGNLNHTNSGAQKIRK